MDSVDAQAAQVAPVLRGGRGLKPLRGHRDTYRDAVLRPSYGAGED